MYELFSQLMQGFSLDNPLEYICGFLLFVVVVSLIPEQFRDEASLSELVVSFFSAAVKSTCSVSPLFAGGPLFPIGKKAPFVKGR